MTGLGPFHDPVVRTIVVPGEPEPWSVYTRRGPQPLAHQRLQAWQESIRAHARKAMGDREPWDGPVSLDIQFRRAWPPSAPQTTIPRGRWARGNIVRPPDLTNYQKGAEDALRGIVYRDDAQVCSVSAEKVYSDQAMTIINVWRD